MYTKHIYILQLKKLLYSYVEMMTLTNWVLVAPQLSKAVAAMEVVVVGMVTFAQPQQEVQGQYIPPINRRKETTKIRTFRSD